MSQELLIVNKKLLPKCFEKVVEAKKLINSGKCQNISEACRLTGISRGTFYKYQDNVFSYSKENKTRKIVLSLTLDHKTGVLNKLCDIFSKSNTSIITISQSIPINNVAPLMVSLDISNLDKPIEDFINKIKAMKDIHDLKIISIE